MVQGEPQPQWQPGPQAQPESQLQPEWPLQQSQQPQPESLSQSQPQPQAESLSQPQLQPEWQLQPEQSQPEWHFQQQPQQQWQSESDWRPELQPEYDWPPESEWHSEPDWQPPQPVQPEPEPDPEFESKSRGCGCAIIVALLVVVAFLAGRATGAIDHLQYVLSGAQDRGVEAIDEEFEAVVDTELQDRYYAYSMLDDDEKRCYRIMYDAFVSREPHAYPEDGVENISKIRACVIADHPELFYVEGVTYSTTYNQVTGLVTDASIEGTFYMDADEAATRQAQSDIVAQAFLATVPQDADDYAKAKLAYEYIVQLASYDHDAAEAINGYNGEGRAGGQTMDDVFVDGVAVCAGYSAAYQYLLQHMGIPCVQVRGTAEGVGHAWCIALLDGAYYQIDPTWGDPQFLDSSAGVGDGYVNYDFLAVTTDDISSTHVVDSEFAVPACTATADNYYVREDLLFEGADAQRLARLVADAEASGAAAVQVRCTNDEAYYWLLEGFIATGDLGYSLSDYEYRYTTFPAMRTITVFP